MRSCSLLLAVGLLWAPDVFATDYQFSWALPQPQGGELRSVVFESDESRGYAVGMVGAVLVTTDRGVTWALAAPLGGFVQDLEDMLVMGPADLLAVGSGTGIFRSQDGGATWSDVPNPSTSTLRSIVRIDETTLSAVGDAGQVLRSTDNGQTWFLTPPPKDATLEDQLWLDGNHGFALGFHCARQTTNGGAT